MNHLVCDPGIGAAWTELTPTVAASAAAAAASNKTLFTPHSMMLLPANTAWASARMSARLKPEDDIRRDADDPAAQKSHWLAGRVGWRVAAV
jgi:hypothetical protein